MQISQFYFIVIQILHVDDNIEGSTSLPFYMAFLFCSECESGTNAWMEVARCRVPCYMSHCTENMDSMYKGVSSLIMLLGYTA